MTRAKEELILCSTQPNLFIQQAGLTSQITNYAPSQQQAGLTSQITNYAPSHIPQLMHYFDLTPADLHLGHRSTKNKQGIIKLLLEGTSIILRTNDWGNGWSIFTQDNNEIGALSRGGTQSLRDRGIHPGQFEFQFGEVTVRYIYNHTKIDEVTGELLEDWFLIIPQIRVCR
jgi:ATP-dependent DNA helicase RecQ